MAEGQSNQPILLTWDSSAGTGALIWLKILVGDVEQCMVEFSAAEEGDRSIFSWLID